MNIRWRAAKLGRKVGGEVGGECGKGNGVGRETCGRRERRNRWTGRKNRGILKKEGDGSVTWVVECLGGECTRGDTGWKEWSKD